MQMLFQADIGKQTPDQVRATFWKAGDEVEPEVRGFAEDLFRVAVAHQEQIDELLVANSKHWRLERMPAVDRNLLRMAVGEMLGFKGTPFPIVINEALEIAPPLLRPRVHQLPQRNAGLHCAQPAAEIDSYGNERRTVWVATPGAPVSENPDTGPNARSPPFGRKAPICLQFWAKRYSFAAAQLAIRPAMNS